MPGNPELVANTAAALKSAQETKALRLEMKRKNDLEEQRMKNEQAQAKKAEKTAKDREKASKAPEKPKGRQDFREKKFRAEEIRLERKISPKERIKILEDAAYTDSMKTNLGRLKDALNSDPSQAQWETKIKPILKDINGMPFKIPVDVEIQQEVNQMAMDYYYDHWASFNEGHPLEIKNDVKGADKRIYNATTRRREKDLGEIKKNRNRIAKSDKPENSDEWTREVERQMLVESKDPPQLANKPYDELKSAIGNRYAENSVKWLTDGKMPTTREGAQVLLDILDNPNPTKEFLYVKGSQLVHAEKANMDANNRPELSVMNKKFRSKVGEEYYQDKKSVRIDQVDKVRNDLMEFPKSEAVIEPGKSGHYIEESKIDAIKGTSPKIQSFKDFLHRYSRDLGRESQGPPFENAQAAGAYKGKILDYWEEYHEEFMNDSEVGFGAKIPGTNDKIPEIATFESQIRKLLLDGSSILEDTKDRGWSDMFLSPRIMKVLHGDTLKKLYEMNDQERMELTLFDNDVSQALGRARHQMIGYISHPDFRTNRMAFLENNAAYVQEASGIRFELENKYDHPWYKEVSDAGEYQKFRSRVTKLGNDATSLKAMHAMMKSNAGFDKMKGAADNLGDDGILRILNERGGGNAQILDAMRRVGATCKWDEVSGEWTVVSGPTFDDAKKAVIHEVLNHRELYNALEKWAGNGKDYKLTALDVEYAYEEMKMLRIATGDRAIDVKMGATPFDNRGQGDDFIAQFAGQTEDYNFLQIWDPIQKVWFRWGMNSHAEAPVLRRLGFNEAAKQGIDVEVKNALATVKPGSKEFEKIARKYFNIQKNPKLSAKEQADVDRNGLGQLDLIKRGLRGYDISSLPTTIAELKMDELQDYIKFREGLNLIGGRMTGGWTYRDSGWVNQTIISCFNDESFMVHGPDVHGVGLHERAKLHFDDVINGSTHEGVHDAQHNLLHAHEGHDSMTVELGKYDPVSVIDALHEKGFHAPTEEFIEQLAAESNIFHDTITVKGLEANEFDTKITGSRYDLLNKYTSKRVQLIEQQMATGIDKPDGSVQRFGRVDYSKGAEYFKNTTNPYEQGQYELIKKVCDATHVNTDEYLNLMKKMSDFALKKEIMNTLVNPLYGQYFINVHTPDSRVRFVDSFTETRKNFSQKISASGPGGATGVGRLVGDNATVEKSIPAFYAALKSANYKDYRTNLTQFVDGAQWAGGQGARASIILSMDSAWLPAAATDFDYAMLNMGKEGSRFETSEMQRAAGLSRPSMDPNEVDHGFHDGESAAGVKWHEFNHSAITAAQKDAGLTVGKPLGWPKFITKRVDAWADKQMAKYPQQSKIFKGIKNLFHRQSQLQTVWIYRYWSYGVLAGFVFLAGVYDNAKKGISGGAGGSSGGGGGHEEHH